MMPFLIIWMIDRKIKKELENLECIEKEGI